MPDTAELTHRRWPIGAEVSADGAVSFRVWAPKRTRVEVVVGAPDDPPAAVVPLQREAGGYFSGRARDVAAGALYRFRLDDDVTLYPDPASRFQPAGPHGPSQVVDPSAFRWTDRAWRGVAAEGRVVYETHIGTFTPEGTWAAASREIPALAELGVNVIELMPVAEFPGRFGWGYDGVDMFAPTRLYGAPDEFRAFVDRAHGLGVAVILDVVYNHFGPDGCYLRAFSDSYFTDRYDNEWGDPLNFEGEEGRPVREFFIANAAYWIDEFHLDGLRLDATQQIFDASQTHVIAEITRAVRKAGAGRRTFVVCENEPQDIQLVKPFETGGYGADALWNDDFHHSANVAVTGAREAYYTDYAGTPQELVSAVKWGYLYQGQHYKWQRKRRGTISFHAHPAAFIDYLQNHDQVANSARGLRLHQLTSPGRYRAITALLLLGPHTPMLFQGQEFAASAPFLFFADHNPDLARAVRQGRRDFLSQFPSIGETDLADALADPGADDTFERCKLDLSERDTHAGIYALHRDLLQLRREDPVLRRPRPRGIDGAVLGPQAFVLRFFGDDEDRLLIVNLGTALTLDIAPEPLLAAPRQRGWRMVWSSELPAYGGIHPVAPERDTGWEIPSEAAMLLAPGG